MWKGQGQKHPFWPHLRRDGPSRCPETSSLISRIFGLSSNRRLTREAGTPKWRGFETKDWQVSERYWLGCRPKHDFDGEDQLEDGCGHLAPCPTIFGPRDTQYVWNSYLVISFFDVAHHYPERRVLFLSHIFVPTRWPVLPSLVLHCCFVLVVNQRLQLIHSRWVHG